MFLDWKPDDQDKAIAYMLWHAEICPSCGTRNDYWVDERGRFLDEPRYEAVTHKCFGCEQVDRLRGTIPSDSPGVYAIAQRRTPGLILEVERREAEMAARQRAEKASRLPDGGLFG